LDKSNEHKDIRIIVSDGESVVVVAAPDRLIERLTSDEQPGNPETSYSRSAHLVEKFLTSFHIAHLATF
jgi:hypothetical protein